MRNQGHISQDVAFEELQQLYPNIQKMANTSFYDFKVPQSPLHLLIETKWCNCHFWSVDILLPWTQAHKLLEYKYYRLYIRTNRGHFFVTPETVFEYSHVHRMSWNHNVKYLLLKFTRDMDNNFEPNIKQQCTTCKGLLKDNLEYFMKDTHYTNITKRIFKI